MTFMDILNSILNRLNRTELWVNVFCVVAVLFILLVISGTINTIKGWFNTPEKAGKKYENEVAKHLTKHFKFPLLRNVLIPSKMNGITEIDMVLITTRGLFCIECKHRSTYNDRGSYRASMNTDVWEAGGLNQPLPNPFHQNYGHVKSLQAVVGESVPIFNIVCLSTLFTFSHFGEKTESEAHPFIDLLNDHKKGLISTHSSSKGIKQFKKAVNKMPVCFSDQDVENITKYLTPYVASKEQLKLHASYVQSTHAQEDFEDTDSF